MWELLSPYLTASPPRGSEDRVLQDQDRNPLIWAEVRLEPSGGSRELRGAEDQQPVCRDSRSSDTPRYCRTAEDTRYCRDTEHTEHAPHSPVRKTGESGTYLRHRTGVRLVQHLSVDVSASSSSSSAQSLHQPPGQQAHTLLPPHTLDQTEDQDQNQDQETSQSQRRTGGQRLGSAVSDCGQVVVGGASPVCQLRA